MGNSLYVRLYRNNLFLKSSETVCVSGILCDYLVSIFINKDLFFFFLACLYKFKFCSLV